MRVQQFSNVSETSMQSSDNSTDSSEGSMGQFDGPNLETEKNLPSVVCNDIYTCIYKCMYMYMYMYYYIHYLN